MSEKINKLISCLKSVFGEDLQLTERLGEVTIEVESSRWVETCETLADRQDLLFEQLIDLCGVDYAAYGRDEWINSDNATSTGFGRGARRDSMGKGSTINSSSIADEDKPKRFGVVAHLNSVTHNWRLRIRTFAADDGLPVVPSLVNVWSSVNWFEREAFDLYGIVFDGHPDLRRILTDYGFVGHPFRKDFPLIGNVEVKYDEQQKRVVYQPVSIEPRTLVPKVIRHDSRYGGVDAGGEADNA